MSAYYNENDPFAAAWLRELIERNLIAPGVVDERDIRDVRPIDLRGFTQCHFFAGIGVWSYALRQAGISDAQPLWTGSCPCQPFSSAGKRDGFADERHLWPAWHWLIKELQPPVVFGEQVASKDADAWIDLVQADLEALDYAFGCVPFPSAGVGAPHIRDRAYWMGYALGARLERHGGDGNGRDESGRLDSQSSGSTGATSAVGGLADDSSERRNGGQDTAKAGRWTCAEAGGEAGGLADMHGNGRDQAGRRVASSRSDGAVGDGRAAEGESSAGPVNGFWRDADWLFCRNGEWRPVRPGSFPLADGAPARVGRLRGYGNAINAEAAKAFIEVASEYFR